MSDYSLQKTFDKLYADVRVDKHLGKKVVGWLGSWLSRNTSNMEFAGTRLLGTVRPSFTATDIDLVFSDIFGTEKEKVDDAIQRLKVVPSGMQVASDVYNLSIMWLIHGFLKAKLPKYAEEAYMLFGYKVLIRRHNYFFSKFLVDESIASAAYEKMSRHYILKTTGSVDAMLRYRARDFVDRKGVNYPRVYKFDSAEVFKAVIDGYGRLNSMLKSVMGITMATMQEGERVGSKSAVMDTIDGLAVRSITEGSTHEVERLLSRVSDSGTFIIDEHIELAISVTRLEQPRALREVLVWVSDNIISPKYGKDIREVITRSLVISFDHLGNNGVDISDISVLPAALVKLRGMWGSSRGNVPDQRKTIDMARKIVQLSTGRKDSGMVASLATGFLIYLVIKTVIKT